MLNLNTFKDGFPKFNEFISDCMTMYRLIPFMVCIIEGKISKEQMEIGINHIFHKYLRVKDVDFFGTTVPIEFRDRFLRFVRENEDWIKYCYCDYAVFLGIEYGGDSTLLDVDNDRSNFYTGKMREQNRWSYIGLPINFGIKSENKSGIHVVEFGGGELPLFEYVLNGDSTLYSYTSVDKLYANSDFYSDVFIRCSKLVENKNARNNGHCQKFQLIGEDIFDSVCKVWKMKETTHVFMVEFLHCLREEEIEHLFEMMSFNFQKLKEIAIIDIMDEKSKGAGFLFGFHMDTHRDRCRSINAGTVFDLGAKYGMKVSIKEFDYDRHVIDMVKA